MDKPDLTEPILITEIETEEDWILVILTFDFDRLVNSFPDFFLPNYFGVSSDGMGALHLVHLEDMALLSWNDNMTLPQIPMREFRKFYASGKEN